MSVVEATTTSLVGEPRPLAFDPRMTDEERARLVELLPELEWIGDERLRELTLQLWAHAWRCSPWADPTDCYTLSRSDVGSNQARWNFVAHTRVVTQTSYTLAVGLRDLGELPFDMDLLVAVGLLHDVGKLVEFEPGPDSAVRSELGQTVHHATIGAQWALEAGLSPLLAQAIFAHTPVVKTESTTPEGVLLSMIDHTSSVVTQKIDGAQRAARAAAAAGEG
jgi:putative nucleotidyltransferase with HDIG domain